MRAALLAALIVAACGSPPPSTVPAAPSATAAEARRALLASPLVDVRTAEPFTLGQFSGRVVVVLGIAVW